MRHLFVFCAALVLLQAADRESRIKQVEAGLRSPAASESATWTIAERLKHYKAPGVSVAVIFERKIEWARGYGVLEAGNAHPVTPETLFQAASISKPVAAAALLRLVQDGKLDLDEDVNRKLVSWKVPGSEFSATEKVTLRRLLSHSAGLTVHGFRGYAAGERVPTLLELLDGKPPANSAPIRVDVLPGSRWRYSGGGYSVAQQLLIDVTGKAWPEAVEQLVLRPIGMKQSSYVQPLPAARAPHASVGHRPNGNPLAGRWHTYPEMAAAGLWTTPSDLARFAIDIAESYAGRAGRVLSQPITFQMMTRQSGSYGLGLSVDGQGKNLRVGHGGSNVGYKCTLVSYPELGLGAVVMTNSDNAAIMGEILRSIAAAYDWPEKFLKQ